MPNRVRSQISRWVILIAALLFFLGPIAAATKFALIGDHGQFTFVNFGAFVSRSAIRSSLVTSLEIGGLTMAVVLLLMVPTVVFVRLRMPKLTLLLESVTILPIVIPPVVMAAGLSALQAGAGHTLQSLLFASPLSALTPFYVVLAMPFTYRSLDTGVRAIDVRTLVDAARNLGAGWTRVLLLVVLPNIRSAVLGSAFLTLALVLGEVVISKILLYTTFPVQLVQVGQASAGISVALSVEALLFTWLLLLLVSFLGGNRSSAGRGAALRRRFAGGRAGAQIPGGSAR
jgi:putative spermidine/putrescine transport system permease protein